MQQPRTQAFKDAPKEWLVGNILGRGSYGDVRRCSIGGKDYAVKAQKLGRRQDDTLAKHIIVEHDIGTAAPEDSTLMRVIGIEIKNAMVFTVMPLYGATLQTILKSVNGFSEKSAAELAADIGAALAALHGAGVIHRDVKPANIMTNPKSPLGRGCYVLGDYGVSNIASVANTCIGTPYTMAPEMNRAATYGPSIDIWGAGCCLYEALFCQPPFNGSTTKQLQARIARGLTDQQTSMLIKKAPIIGRLISECLQVKEVKRPDANSLSRRAHSFMDSMGFVFKSANTRLELDTSATVARMRRALPGSLRKMCRQFPPVEEHHSDPVCEVSPFKLPSISGNESDCTPKQRKRWGKVVSIYGDRADSSNVYPAVARRAGRTHDFEAAINYGSKVEGYHYLGKVYVTRALSE